MSPLSVLSIAYPLTPVHSNSVGGAEQILLHLDAALVARGHRSFVVAAEGSRVAGVLKPIPLEKGPIDGDIVARAHAAVRHAAARVLAREHVDVVHMHGIDFHRYVPADSPPILVTLHLPPTWYPREALIANSAPTHFCCVSRTQRSVMPPWAPAAIAENGIATSVFRPRRSKVGFCLVLARICPEKGIEDALAAAEEAGVPLLIGGEVAPWPAHQEYWTTLRRKIRLPHRWLGPLDLSRKRRLLAAATAVLVPSRAPETSSLVAMEALASGTPVIAYAAGALPEIVEEGATGFIVDDVRAMARAIVRARELSPDRCRQAAVERFSVERMAERYIGIYERLAKSERTIRPAVVAEEIIGIEALAAIAPEWIRLWARCATASAFQRPEWLLAYARVFCAGPHAEPWAIAVRQGGELVGIVPLCTRGTTTTLMGDGVTDYRDAIVDHAHARSVTSAIVGALAKLGEHHTIVLEGMKEGSPLLAAPPLPGCSEQSLEGVACPFVPLPAGIDPIPPKMRTRIVDAHRHANRLGRIAIEHVTGALAVSALETLFALHTARWAERGQPGIFAGDDVRAFQREAVGGLARAGLARLGVLRIGRRAAGATLILRDSWADAFYIGGFDPSFRKASPVRILIAEGIDVARREGKAEIDFLRGREPYKYEFGARDRFTRGRRFVAGRSSIAEISPRI